MTNIIGFLLIGVLLYTAAEGVAHMFNLNMKAFKTEKGFLLRKGILAHSFLSRDADHWFSSPAHIRDYAIFDSMEKVNAALSVIEPMKYGTEVEIKKKVS